MHIEVEASTEDEESKVASETKGDGRGFRKRKKPGWMKAYFEK